MSSPKGWSDLRPEVQAFALLMESKLREHDPVKGKDTWKYDSYEDLLGRVEEESEEMADAIADLYRANRSTYSKCVQNFVDEAVDVANMSMMAIDVLQKLPIAVLQEYKSELQKVQDKLDSANRLVNELDIDRKIAEAKVKLATTSRQDVWIWQGDGHDDLATLTAPVVMSADTLQEILEKLEKSQKILAQKSMENLISKLEKQQSRQTCTDPNPSMIDHWENGDFSPLDGHLDEIRIIRKTIAWLVKRQWDAEAKQKDISAENADTRSRK